MLQEISDLLNEVSGAIVAGDSSLMRSLAKKMTEQQALELLTNKVYYHKYLSSSGSYGYYRTAEFVKMLVFRYRSIADDVIEANLNERVTLLLLSHGYYSNIDIFNKLALNTQGNVQVFAAHHCSIETLKKLKSSTNKKVRKIYYSRMGVVEAIDDMLDDSIASFRGDGVRLAPFGYHKLKGMTNEVSVYPFTNLINKISAEDIPMILANRNIKKYKWIGKSIQQRLDEE